MYVKETVCLREKITDDRFHFSLLVLIKTSTNKKPDLGTSLSANKGKF